MNLHASDNRSADRISEEKFVPMGSLGYHPMTNRKRKITASIREPGTPGDGNASLIKYRGAWPRREITAQEACFRGKRGYNVPNGHHQDGTHDSP